MKIKLLENIPAAYGGFHKKDEIFESDEPYQGLNEDGTFTIYQGQDIYIAIKKNQFKIIE